MPCIGRLTLALAALAHCSGTDLGTGLCSLATNPVVGKAARYVFSKNALFSPAVGEAAIATGTSLGFPGLGATAAAALPFADKTVGCLVRSGILQSAVGQWCKSNDARGAPQHFALKEEHVRRSIGDPAHDYLLLPHVRRQKEQDDCVSYPAGASFCRDIGHQHQVPADFSSSLLVDDRNVHLQLAWERLKSHSEVQALLHDSLTCGDSVKDVLCLQAFPICQTSDLTPCVMACRNVKLCFLETWGWSASGDDDHVTQQIVEDCTKICKDHVALEPILAAGHGHLHVSGHAYSTPVGQYVVTAEKYQGSFIWQQVNGPGILVRDTHDRWAITDSWDAVADHDGFAVGIPDGPWPTDLEWLRWDSDGGVMNDLTVTSSNPWDFEEALTCSASGPSGGRYERLLGVLLYGLPVWQHETRNRYIKAQRLGGVGYYWVTSNVSVDHGKLYYSSRGSVQGPPSRAEVWDFWDEKKDKWVRTGIHVEAMGMWQAQVPTLAARAVAPGVPLLLAAAATVPSLMACCAGRRWLKQRAAQRWALLGQQQEQA